MCKMGIVGISVLVVVNMFMNISCLDLHWANCTCSIKFNNYLVVFLPSIELFLNPCMALKKKKLFVILPLTTSPVSSLVSFSFVSYSLTKMKHK